MSEAGTSARRKGSSEGDGSNRLVALGRISGVFGVQGWVKVHSDTDPVENIVRYSIWRLSGPGREETRRVEQGKRHGKGVIAKLSGCDDRGAAEDLRGLEISIRRDQLPGTLEEGEYYWTDIEGLAVETIHGVRLGKVDRLFETGSNDVMVVRGDRERLIPFIRGQVVLGVDLDARSLQVDWDPEF